MAMKYQKGTVYLCGEKVKMWYGKYLIYEKDLISQFGDWPLRQLDTFAIQVWLNRLANIGYSLAIVRHCFTNVRAITCMAKKQKFLADDPGEDLTIPQTKPAVKPVMTREQMLALIGAIEDVHDLCLMHVGIFCGLRASEIMGLQWKSWTGEVLIPHGTAYDGQFFEGRMKTTQSKAPIPVPDQVRPVIEA